VKAAFKQSNNSVLFFNPDYHCSFFLRDELRNRGWVAEVSVSTTYPTLLLWTDDVIRVKNKIKLINFVMRWAQVWKFKYVIHYGRMSSGSNWPAKCLDHLIMGWARLLRLLGKRYVYVPSGCRDHVSKADWLKVDEGNVCGNCGFEPNCRDKDNSQNFKFVRSVASTALFWDGHQTSEFKETRIRYKSFDLSFYRPDLVIPSSHMWQPSEDIRILHSHSLDGRLLGGKNIKGTPFVIDAVDKLKAEGHKVSLVNLTGIPSREMRFHQVQADIIVDQLIYGGYGSTALEGLALGKPVICFIRPAWKSFLASIYPEWANCPIISATTETVFHELRKLVTDEGYRNQKSLEGRVFAEKFLDVKKNVIELEELLLSLA